MKKAHRIPVQAAWLGMLLLAGSDSAAQTLTGSPAPTPALVNGLYATAPIVLDGQTLFNIAAPANPTTQAALGVRAAEIDDTLEEIVGAGDDGGAYDPRTLRVTVDRRRAGDVVRVTDEGHKSPLAIATVTAADAAAQNATAEALAAQWQEALQVALVHAVLIREPRVQQRHLIEAAIAAAILLLLTLGGAIVLRRLGARITALGAEVEAQQESLEAAQSSAANDKSAATDEHRRRVRSLLAGALRPQQRLTALRAVRDLLIWTLLLGWCAGAAWAALQFPETTPIGHTLVRSGLVIAGIFIVTGVIDRTLTIVIARLPAVWELRAFANAQERERQTLRMPTIVRAMSGFKTFVLVFIAVLTAMTQIGIPVGSVVTIGGVAAIAVTLAAQNLIRDVVSGFLVLSEDQFVLGDFVTINGASGVVERLTLRMVQLRDGSGGVVTISHSAATSVVNHSRNWSRVDYAVAIDPAADASAAIALIRSAIEQLAADQAWKNAIAGPVEWIGVDGLSRDGIIVRARIRTAPLRQFALQRELNLRVSAAFREAKIAYGAPVAAVSPSS